MQPRRAAREKRNRFAKFSVARSPATHTHNLYVENYGETFEGDTWGEFSRWVLLKPI